MPLVIGNPRGVAISPIAEMRCQQDVEMIIFQQAFQRHEMSPLQNGITFRIRNDVFPDAIATPFAGILQTESGNALGWICYLRPCVTLFLGKEIASVCNNHPHVARTGPVHARIVYFIENAMAEGKPYAARKAESGSQSVFSA